MLSEYIIDMLRCFDELQACCAAFSASVHKDNELPIFLPHSSNSIAEDRDSVINSITRLWWPEVDEEFNEQYGVLCVSNETAEVVTTLNESKKAFRESILTIKSAGKDNKDGVEKLIDRALNKEGLRTPELKQALDNARLSRLDLVKCYTLIRMLPKEVDSISYTWATNHSSVSQITAEDAVEMAESLSDENLKKTITAKLANLNPKELLAYKKEKPNQLRANLVYTYNDEFKRQQVAVSGVMLYKNTSLPRIIWRDNPETKSSDNRIKRFDSKIEPKPFINALNIYRYIKPEAKKNGG